MRLFSIAIILLSIFSVADVVARDFNPRELAFINAVASCRQQFETSLANQRTILQGTFVEHNDLDTWELIIGAASPSPMVPQRVFSVLTISRSFEPTICQPGEMDCGGGHFTYRCELKTASEGIAPGACRRDINEFGNSSACSCAPQHTYDPRLGRCYGH